VIDQFFFISTISLFDSLSTTQQIVVFILLLTTVNPIRNALSYLAGLSGTYFLCGIAGYCAFDRLTALLGKFFPSTATVPDRLYYLAELIAGALSIIIGIWYYQRNRVPKKSRIDNVVIARLRSMNPWIASGIGIFISITSFPFSIPYLVALGKFAGLKMGLPAATACIMLYNVGYALPMIVVFGLYLYARRKSNDLHDTLHEKARLLNVKLTTWMFAGIGAFSMIDATAFFLLGHPFIKGRYF
jgi:cytochrome c biogenesis protein CcdA